MSQPWVSSDNTQLNMTHTIINSKDHMRPNIHKHGAKKGRHAWGHETE